MSYFWVASLIFFFNELLFLLTLPRVIIYYLTNKFAIYF